MQVPAAGPEDRHEPDWPAGGAATGPLARHSREEAAPLAGRRHVHSCRPAGGKGGWSWWCWNLEVNQSLISVVLPTVHLPEHGRSHHDFYQWPSNAGSRHGGGRRTEDPNQVLARHWEGQCQVHEESYQGEWELRWTYWMLSDNISQSECVVFVLLSLCYVVVACFTVVVAVVLFFCCVVSSNLEMF